VNGRRLLVITYYFGSRGPVGGLRWLGMTKYLARLGWRIAVITGVPPVVNEAPTGVHVEWCPRLWTFSDGWRLLQRVAFGPSRHAFPAASRAIHSSERPGLLRQLGREVRAFLTLPDESRGWLLRAALRTRAVMRRFQPQVVVSSGPPHAAHLVAALATRGSTAPWFIDLRDPWAGPLGKIWDTDRTFGTRLFRATAPRLERHAVGAARGIITNTQQLASALAERYPEVPVACVPNGVDPALLPSPGRHRYPGLGIAYAGTLYTGRDLGPVVQALRVFLDQHPEAAEAGAKIRVAGKALDGHGRAFYDAVAAAGMEQYVEVLGPLPRVEALNVVAASRLAVVLAEQQELQIPAKLYESVAMGIPTLVVAPAHSAAGIEGERIGAIVRDPADVAGIACVLERVWRDGSGRRNPCPASITYEAVAPVMDELFRKSYTPDDAGRR
jgi:glycosyltransferase involved in cell wall biosynthesis